MKENVKFYKHELDRLKEKIDSFVDSLEDPEYIDFDNYMHTRARKDEIEDKLDILEKHLKKFREKHL